jgi:hypothetical protein
MEYTVTVSNNGLNVVAIKNGEGRLLSQREVSDLLGLAKHYSQDRRFFQNGEHTGFNPDATTP